ncbi:MAG: SAM-dependent methyltransferase [Candidatus Omnitrophica bacterium]|nr:SAM-dependent methyltransferase [Candidatus Omnitrophota bacterium]
MRGPPLCYHEAEKISISGLLGVLSASVPSQLSLFPGDQGVDGSSGMPNCYPLPISANSREETEIKFGKNRIFADITIGNFDIPYFEFSLFGGHERLQQLLSMLEYYYGRAPPELTSWRLVISSDLNLTQGNVAACNIDSKTVYLHPYFFELPEPKQLEIFYHELISHIVKGIRDEDSAMRDTESFSHSCGRTKANSVFNADPVNDSGLVLTGRNIVPRILKCLILDCDGVLWGGVVGEDGISNIRLSQDYIDFQRAVKVLKEKGIILAINSKNNLNDIEEVLRGNPDMVLKRDDFTVIKANWHDKATNLKEIANELNIGSDTIVFIDDSPYERELIRSLCPEVQVPNLPDGPKQYTVFIRRLELAIKNSITEEDRRRADLYSFQKQREELKQKTTSLEEYYRSLNMEARIRQGEENQPYIDRISQLTQRTNQFNLTTTRYSEEQVSVFLKDPKYKVFTLELADRFGNDGIIGLMILYKVADAWVIDTFCLSCRALGRTIEQAFMSYVIRSLKNGETKILRGYYIRTNKNQLVMNVYKKFGFVKVIEDIHYYKDALNVQRLARDANWCGEMELSKSTLVIPDWITVINVDFESNRKVVLEGPSLVLGDKLAIEAYRLKISIILEQIIKYGILSRIDLALKGLNYNPSGGYENLQGVFAISGMIVQNKFTGSISMSGNDYEWDGYNPVDNFTLPCVNIGSFKMNYGTLEEAGNVIDYIHSLPEEKQKEAIRNAWLQYVLYNESVGLLNVVSEKFINRNEIECAMRLSLIFVIEKSKVRLKDNLACCYGESKAVSPISLTNVDYILVPKEIYNLVVDKLSSDFKGIRIIKINSMSKKIARANTGFVKTDFLVPDYESAIINILDNNPNSAFFLHAVRLQESNDRKSCLIQPNKIVPRDIAEGIVVHNYINDIIKFQDDPTLFIPANDDLYADLEVYADNTNVPGRASKEQIKEWVNAAIENLAISGKNDRDRILIAIKGLRTVLHKHESYYDSEVDIVLIDDKLIEDLPYIAKKVKSVNTFIDVLLLEQTFLPRLTIYKTYIEYEWRCIELGSRFGHTRIELGFLNKTIFSYFEQAFISTEKINSKISSWAKAVREQNEFINEIKTLVDLEAKLRIGNKIQGTSGYPFPVPFQFQQKSPVRYYQGQFVKILVRSLANNNYELILQEGKFYQNWQRVLEQRLANLNQIVRGPPKFTLIIATNLNFTQGNVAACNIDTKTVYLHPYFFELPEPKQLEILYHELISHIVKGIRDEDSAMRDTIAVVLQARGNIDIRSEDGSEFELSYGTEKAASLGRVWNLISLYPKSGKSVGRSHLHFRFDPSEKLAYMDTSFWWAYQGRDVDGLSETWESRERLENIDDSAISVDYKLRSEYRGIGSALMSVGLTIAKNQGAKEFILRDLDRAPGFYKKIGFSPEDTFDLLNQNILPINIKKKELLVGNPEDSHGKAGQSVKTTSGALEILEKNRGDERGDDEIRVVSSREEALLNRFFTFKGLMEEAMYNRVWGFYSSGHIKFGGRDCDFDTWPIGLSPAFGYMIAENIFSMWEGMLKAGDIEEDDIFIIAELGAGDATLAVDILTYIKKMAAKNQHWDLFFSRLQYVIGERAPALRRIQLEKTAEFLGIVSVYDLDARDIYWSFPVINIKGVVLSNELVDEMEVHKVRFSPDEEAEVAVIVPWVKNSVLRRILPDSQADKIIALQRALLDGSGIQPREWKAYLSKDDFISIKNMLAGKNDARLERYFDNNVHYKEIFVPAAQIPELVEFLDENQTQVSLAVENLEAPLIAYINPGGPKYIEDAAKLLYVGYVITIDYGGSTLFNLDDSGEHLQRMAKGTIYRDNPFSSLGRSDITSDVDFSALAARGLKKGLRVVFYGDQRLLEDGACRGESSFFYRPEVRYVCEKNFRVRYGISNKDKIDVAKQVQERIEFFRGGFYTGQNFNVLIQQKEGTDLDYVYPAKGDEEELGIEFVGGFKKDAGPAQTEPSHEVRKSNIRTILDHKVADEAVAKIMHGKITGSLSSVESARSMEDTFNAALGMLPERMRADFSESQSVSPVIIKIFKSMAELGQMAGREIRLDLRNFISITLLALTLRHELDHFLNPQDEEAIIEVGDALFLFDFTKEDLEELLHVFPPYSNRRDIDISHYGVKLIKRVLMVKKFVNSRFEGKEKKQRFLADKLFRVLRVLPDLEMSEALETIKELEQEENELLAEFSRKLEQGVTINDLMLNRVLEDLVFILSRKELEKALGKRPLSPATQNVKGNSNGKYPGIEKLQESILKRQGNLAAVASDLGVTRPTISNWIAKDLRLKKLVEESKKGDLVKSGKCPGIEKLQLEEELKKRNLVKSSKYPGREKFQTLILKHRGLLVPVAETLGVSLGTVVYWLSKDSELQKLLEDLRKEYPVKSENYPGRSKLRELISEHKGNLAATASVLDIHKTTLGNWVADDQELQDLLEDLKKEYPVKSENYPGRSKLRELISEHKGNLAAIASVLSVSLTTLERWVVNDEELQKLSENSKELFSKSKDYPGREKLRELINEHKGNLTAVAFALNVHQTTPGHWIANDLELKELVQNLRDSNPESDSKYPGREKLKDGKPAKSRKHPGQDKLAELIRGHQGNIAAISSVLGVSRKTIDNWISQDQELCIILQKAKRDKYPSWDRLFDPGLSIKVSDNPCSDIKDIDIWQDDISVSADRGMPNQINNLVFDGPGLTVDAYWGLSVNRLTGVFARGYSIKEECRLDDTLGDFYSWLIMKDGKRMGFMRVQVKDRNINVREIFPCLPSGEGYGTAVFQAFLTYQNRWAGYAVKMHTPSISAYHMCKNMNESGLFNMKFDDSLGSYWIIDFTVPCISNEALVKMRKIRMLAENLKVNKENCLILYLRQKGEEDRVKEIISGLDIVDINYFSGIDAPAYRINGVKKILKEKAEEIFLEDDPVEQGMCGQVHRIYHVSVNGGIALSTIDDDRAWVAGNSLDQPRFFSRLGRRIRGLSFKEKMVLILGSGLALIALPLRGWWGSNFFGAAGAFLTFLTINPEPALGQEGIKKPADIGYVAIIDPDKMLVRSKPGRLLLQWESQENTDIPVEAYIRLNSPRRCSAVKLLKYLRRTRRIWYAQDVAECAKIISDRAVKNRAVFLYGGLNIGIKTIARELTDRGFQVYSSVVLFLDPDGKEAELLEYKQEGGWVRADIADSVGGHNITSIGMRKAASEHPEYAGEFNRLAKALEILEDYLMQAGDFSPVACRENGKIIWNLNEDEIVTILQQKKYTLKISGWVVNQIKIHESSINEAEAIQAQIKDFDFEYTVDTARVQKDIQKFKSEVISKSYRNPGDDEFKIINRMWGIIFGFRVYLHENKRDGAKLYEFLKEFRDLLGNCAKIRVGRYKVMRAGIDKKSLYLDESIFSLNANLALFIIFGSFCQFKGISACAMTKLISELEYYEKLFCAHELGNSRVFRYSNGNLADFLDRYVLKGGSLDNTIKTQRRFMRLDNDEKRDLKETIGELKKVIKRGNFPGVQLNICRDNMKYYQEKLREVNIRIKEREKAFSALDKLLAVEEMICWQDFSGKEIAAEKVLEVIASNMGYPRGQLKELLSGVDLVFRGAVDLENNQDSKIKLAKWAIDKGFIDQQKAKIAIEFFNIGIPARWGSHSITSRLMRQVAGIAADASGLPELLNAFAGALETLEGYIVKSGKLAGPPVVACRVNGEVVWNLNEAEIKTILVDNKHTPDFIALVINQIKIHEFYPAELEAIYFQIQSALHYLSSPSKERKRVLSKLDKLVIVQKFVDWFTLSEKNIPSEVLFAFLKAHKELKISDHKLKALLYELFHALELKDVTRIHGQSVGLFKSAIDAGLINKEEARRAVELFIHQSTKTFVGRCFRVYKDRQLDIAEPAILLLHGNKLNRDSNANKNWIKKIRLSLPNIIARVVKIKKIVIKARKVIIKIRILLRKEVRKINIKTREARIKARGKIRQVFFKFMANFFKGAEDTNYPINSNRSMETGKILSGTGMDSGSKVQKIVQQVERNKVSGLEVSGDI